MKPDSAARPDVIAAARLWIGTAHAHQHAARGIGCDCLGLIRGVFTELTGRPVAVPPYGRDWPESWLLEGLAGHLAPAAPHVGAVLTFARRIGGPLRHVAIQSGPAAMIHCLERRGVREDFLSHEWRRRMGPVFAFPRGGL